MHSILLTATGAGATESLIATFVPFILIFVMMYFMMIRPQRKRQKEIENFRNGLQPGQDVVTSGGI